MTRAGADPCPACPAVEEVWKLNRGERTTPVGYLLQDRFPAAPGAIGQAGAEGILHIYFVRRYEKLKIPGRVGSLAVRGDAAARRRVGEPYAGRAVEHQDHHHVAVQAVVKRLVVAQR